ncbi:hypothetical protein ACA097_18090 [Pseudomonas sp. QL9]|uniref:Hypothetical membrane protein n=1 Tax=Pseudomonas knackmussii (strain DSM 6978 / CCUG 54928 / LMG 23759 / B13) TaxID=1301098 RepID=A0A024HNA1_PSEKB|nr:hypothetical protein [Pseudomonas knackmussii]CDF85997.1 hypothetical membrane protein [Pseudomonas knackmussii B13]
MSLQALWNLLQAHPGRVVNDLALFFCLAGAWLLFATRRRERHAVSRLVTEGEAETSAPAELDPATARINRFFYHFGFACLAGAVVLSSYSTHLRG